eukprot:1147753-Pelagomonas_calceolata.AAC.15
MDSLVEQHGRNATITFAGQFRLAGFLLCVVLLFLVHVFAFRCKHNFVLTLGAGMQWCHNAPVFWRKE